MKKLVIPKATLLLTSLLLLSHERLTQQVAAQCLITDFEGLSQTANGLYLFRRPNFSGSTAALLDPTFPDSSKVSNEQAHSGSSSLKVQWEFRDGIVSPRWMRLTTFKSALVSAQFPNPTIAFN